MKAHCYLLFFSYHFIGIQNESYNSTFDSRKPKIFWPFILPFYRRTIIPRDPCSFQSQEGICSSKLQCEAGLGTPHGRCANNKGVCCIVERTCGGSSTSLITYFTNPEFPSSSGGNGICQLTINKANDDICQLKLKFLHFDLAQPDKTGTCKSDLFSFGDKSTPTICGYNNDKTVYVDFDPNCDFHQLTVDTDVNLSEQRFWNIEITQISCNSQNLAPSGCLMYFNTTSGSVTSFNYDGRTGMTTSDPTNREITNLNYGVCIKPASGYCEIEWYTPDNLYSFTVSGNFTTGQGVPVSGKNCTDSFVLIPIPTFASNGTALTTDRFCGTKFTAIRWRKTPVVTSNGAYPSYRFPCSSACKSEIYAFCDVREDIDRYRKRFWKPWIRFKI